MAIPIVMLIAILLQPPPIPMSVWGTILDKEGKPYTSLEGQVLTAYCDDRAVKDTVLFVVDEGQYAGQIFYSFDITCSVGNAVTFRIRQTIATQSQALLWSEGKTYQNFTLQFSSANAVVLQELYQTGIDDQFYQVLGLELVALGLILVYKRKRARRKW